MESSDFKEGAFSRLTWSAPSDAGVRLLALEDSDFVFMERKDSAHQLSADLARELTHLGRMAAQSSVILVNEKAQVEALVDLAQNAELLPTDLSIIQTIGVAPRLTMGMGPLKRHTKIANGLWIASFAYAANYKDAVREALELYLIKPWIEGRRCEVLTRFQVPSGLHTPGDAGFAWECRLVRQAPRYHRHRHTGKANYHRYAKFVGGRFVREWIKDPSPDRIEGSSVHNAAVALDHILESIKNSDPPKSDATPEIKPEADPQSPQDPQDVVQRSIALREQLERQVKFVTSADWAKWRGIKSNPAAAIGKYKRNKRVFAVRFSKQDRYPVFQFRDDAEPWPVIHDILTLIPDKAQGWPLLSWFEAKNRTLRGSKPSTLVATDPEAVLTAAKRFYSRDD